MIIFTQHFQANTNPNIDFIIPLTAEQRNRSRQTIELSSLQKLSLRLPRGTVLEDGDLLQSETQEHIEQSIQWLKDHQHQQQYFNLFFNETMSLLTGSWLEKNKHVYQIQLLDSTNAFSWVSPESNLELRKQRSEFLRSTAKSLGYTVYTQEIDTNV